MCPRLEVEIGVRSLQASGTLALAAMLVLTSTPLPREGFCTVLLVGTTFSLQLALEIVEHSAFIMMPCSLD
jgi:hypothetical protein